MTKCRECGARSTEHCDRWDCLVADVRRWPFKAWRIRSGGTIWREPVMTAMNSPLDWDYADIKRRMQGLNAPPYTSASGVAGHHCDHCPKGASEHCLMSCSQAYRDRYGREPSEIGAKIR